jgi:hypothetical protein
MQCDDAADVARYDPPRLVSRAPIDQGAEMRHTFMSIEKGFTTYSEGMTRVAERTQPWNLGACRRR